MPAQKPTAKSTLKTSQPKASPARVIQPEPLKTLLTWQASERPFKKRGREYFTTLGAIIFLLIVILLFLQEWPLIILIIALAFYSYIAATVQPRSVEHQITNRAVVSGGKAYPWGNLGRFWFTEKWGQKILQVENFGGLPGRLLLLLGEVKEEKIKDLLSKYLLFEKPEKTWVDNASDWLSRRVPLETN